MLGSKTNIPGMQAGNEATWMQEMTAFEEMAQQNVKAFLQAVCPPEMQSQLPREDFEKSVDSDAVETEDNPYHGTDSGLSMYELVHYAMSDAQPFTGVVVDVNAVEVITKAGNTIAVPEFRLFRSLDLGEVGFEEAQAAGQID